MSWMLWPMVTIGVDINFYNPGRGFAGRDYC